MADLDAKNEASIALVKTQTPAGQVVYEVSITTTDKVYIPEALTAFPVAQIIYFDRKYICTNFEAGSYEIKDQSEHPVLALAIEAGRVNARGLLERLSHCNLRKSAATEGCNAPIATKKSGPSFWVH